MSVRAYKVKNIDYESQPTFNLWHDQEFIEVVGAAVLGAQLNLDGSGFVEFSRTEILELLKEIEEEDTKINDRTREILEKILKDTQDTDYARYYCF